VPTVTTTGEAAVESRQSPAPALAARILVLFRSPLLQSLVVASLYSFLSFVFLRNFSVTDPDIWWHLRSGEWVLAHRAVPRADFFSYPAAGQPWTAYSWMFESLVALLFRRFGFTGIVFYELGVRVLLGISLFHLVRAQLGHFWWSAALTLAGLFTVSDLLGPRPGMISILFVMLILDILLSVTRSGRTRLLWLIPAMFAIWANWHVQFVYGLFVLGVFACEPMLIGLSHSHLKHEGKLEGDRRGNPLWLILGLSVLATLANPYGVKLYAVIGGFAKRTAWLGQITEMGAPSFREPQHFVLLLLALAAAFTVGWRRNLRPLWRPVWLILLPCSALLSFRSQRDIWFLAVISVVVIADSVARPVKVSHPGVREHFGIAIFTLAMLLVAYRRCGVSNDFLEMGVDGRFPEAAVRYVELQRLPGPLFNHFNWGGFLIWRLPQLPVNIDGRGEIYTPEQLARSIDTWKARPGWELDPDLRGANLVIAPREAPLAAVLRLDAHFELVYQDEQATVFRRKQKPVS
jgi:hypothetical protein